MITPEPEIDQDYGLGVCLECIGRYKLGRLEGNPSMTVHFAIVMCPGPGGMTPTCYEHLQVRKPSSLLNAAPGVARLAQ
jgi:hypothetical protein